jgi:DNA polymerase I
MGYLFNSDAGVSWEIVKTPQGLQETIRELRDVNCFAWDVETNKLNPWSGPIVVGHAFAWRRPNAQLRSVYLPMRHCAEEMLFNFTTQLAPEMVNSAVKPLLEGPALKIGHNLNFDVHAAYADGIRVAGPVHDTLVAAKLMDENQYSYKLHLCLERQGVPHQKDWKDFIKPDLEAAAKRLRVKKSELLNEHGYSLVSVDRLGWYAVQDAAYELRLGEHQSAYNSRWAALWEMEMKLFFVCVDMARVGVPVDKQSLIDLSNEQQAEMDAMAPRIWRLAGEEFEITNDNQIRKILFQKMELPSQGKTERSDLERVDDDALWSLETKHGSEIAGLLRKYNDSQKVVSTYTKAIVARADTHGILHSEIDQSGAKTGRVSSRNPNLQNIPTRTELGRRVRRAFIARPGMLRYCLDYSQAELRVLAHLTQDPILLKVYRQGLDAHSITAKEVFGTDQKVNGTDMRRIAKILNFGVSFGMTDVGLMKNVNKDLPPGQAPVDEARARQFLENFYRKYIGVDRYRQSLWKDARRAGEFVNLFGRPRRLPDIVSPRRGDRSRAERQAISTMVQGSAADMVKHSMVACWEYLRSQQDCEANMVMMIHDDIQYDMAAEGSAKTVRELKRLMEHTCQHKMSVPIKVDCEYFTDNWANKKKLELF